MQEDLNTLHITEIFYESGKIHFRYGRRLSNDGTHWIREGLFCEYYENGCVASEGEYRDALEEGLWRDYHENSQIASEGHYLAGQEDGTWKYWDAEGVLESEAFYRNGVEVE